MELVDSSWSWFRSYLFVRFVGKPNCCLHYVSCGSIFFFLHGLHRRLSRWMVGTQSVRPWQCRLEFASGTCLVLGNKARLWFQLYINKMNTLCFLIQLLWTLSVLNQNHEQDVLNKCLNITIKLTINWKLSTVMFIFRLMMHLMMYVTGSTTNQTFSRLESAFDDLLCW